MKNALICGHYPLSAYANDLRAADAVYHTLSDSAFRNGKSFPKKYNINTNESSSVEPPAKCGKPVNVDRATAFNHVVEYLQENDEEEQLTVNDLVMLMDEQLKNNPHEAFSSKWMKDRLMEQLRNDIVISEINGISVIVTLRKKSSHVLREFYDQQKSSDIEEEKRRIIVVATE